MAEDNNAQEDGRYARMWQEEAARREGVNLDTVLGDFMGSITVDPKRQALMGQGSISRETPVGNLTVGASKNLASDMAAAYRVALQDGDWRLAKQIQGEMSRTSVGYGEHEVGQISTPEGDTPYYGYQNQNMNLEVTPDMIQGNYRDVSPDGRDQVSAGGFASKETYGAQAQYKKLLDNGYIDINGNVTPEGWRVGVGGQINF